MTKKSLAERFDLLEQEYNSVMSTKYMGTSAFNHRRQEYIDSAKGNNW
ncbi:malate dehydrogenase, partial [Salmonella enterica subsp. enterica serovar Typhimurium]|nr:malate dehydrogenase [Salmonella enterica subsp. enterica serovar Typhimurium]